jgi:uncharacterized 2Fe-2S/4Fe-4S cluster protein (DUF4445 family)
MCPAKTVTVNFQPEGRKIVVPIGSTILDAAREGGVWLEGPCGGQGTCGKCRVRVVGDPPEPLAEESMVLPSQDIKRGYRLACRVRVTRDLVVEVPEDSTRYQHLILVTGLEMYTKPKPGIKLERIEEKNKILTRILFGNDEVGKLEGSPGDMLGLALDLGTTTIVAHLVDLFTGQTISSSTCLNPQVVHGDDVISRIKFSQDGKGNSKKLQQEVVDAVNGLIKKACENAPRSSRDIYEIVFAGNTCMHHLFFGLDASGLGRAPYSPSHTGSLSKKTKALGLKTSKYGRIYSLPVIAGYLGADALAVALATGLDRCKGNALAVDIGTNGEILLCKDGHIYGCSAPAGPAFEGAQISCGMRATHGAITWLKIKNNKVETSVIGGGKPRGLAGSAAVDAVAEMLGAGLMETSGKLNPGGPVREGDKGPELGVVDPEKSDTGRPVVFTQADVRQVQLAKSAIATGIEIMLASAKIRADELNEIYVAGAFGNYIGRQSAITIGLLPPVEIKKIVSIGNAAAVGAKRALVSVEERKRAEEIQKKINYVELAGRKDFQERFISNMNLGKSPL